MVLSYCALFRLVRAVGMYRKIKLQCENLQSVDKQCTLVFEMGQMFNGNVG